MKFQRKTYETRPQKSLDFLLGFIGWFLVNGLIWILLVQLAGRDDAPYAVFCMLPLNLIVLIILAYFRRWIALGILVAVALNLAIALILGLFYSGTCAIPFFIGSQLE